MVDVGLGHHSQELRDPGLGGAGHLERSGGSWRSQGMAHPSLGFLRNLAVRPLSLGVMWGAGSKVQNKLATESGDKARQGAWGGEMSLQGQLGSGPQGVARGQTWPMSPCHCQSFAL